MSFTVTSWKETYTFPKYQNIPFTPWGTWLMGKLFNQKYEILFRHRKTDDKTLEYITAYVKLIPPLKEKYTYETERKGNIVGVDTYECIPMPLEEMKIIARDEIINIIEEHHAKDNQT